MLLAVNCKPMGDLASVMIADVGTAVARCVLSLKAQSWCQVTTAIVTAKPKMQNLSNL